MIRTDADRFTCIISGILIVFAMLFVSGCTLASGDGMSWRVASVGGDVSKITGNGATGINNSAGLRAAGELGGKAVDASVTKAVVGAAGGFLESAGDVAEKFTD